jgi:ketosteroid isomerase-like protein
MKRLSIFYPIIALFAVGGLLGCGGDAEKVEPDPKPLSPTPQQPIDEPAPKQVEIDFKAEAADIRGVQTKHATAIGEKDVDAIMSYWLNNNDVFTAWTFWAGAFEKTVGWDDIKKAWPGIFRLRGGQMTVTITSIAINSRATNAVIEAKYKWAVSGDLISTMQKDGKETWKITAIDYTNGKFGKQVKKLNNPAYQE